MAAYVLLLSVDRLDGGQWAIIITAIGTQLAGLVVLLLNHAKSSKIHSLVNGTASAAMNREAQLTAVLNYHGIPVPPHPHTPTFPTPPMWAPPAPPQP